MTVVGQEKCVLENLRFLVSLAWFDLLLTEEERQTLERIADNSNLSEVGRKQAQTWIDRMPGFPEQLVVGCEGFQTPEDILLSAYYIAYVDGHLDPKEEIAIGMGAEILGVGPTRMMEIKAKFLELNDREEALKLPEWRAPAKTEAVAMPEVEVTYEKSNPFTAKLVENRKLSGDKSLKDVRHFAIGLEGGGESMNYKVGDALGVAPRNTAQLVDEILKETGLDGDAKVTKGDKETTLREQLTTGSTITAPFRKLYTTLATKLSGDAKARIDDLLEKANAPKLKEYTAAHQLIDVLRDFGKVEWTPEEFVGCLTDLRGRLYSISSSPKAHPGEVHLCVRRVEYDQEDKTRLGVASNWLSNMEPGHEVPCYMHSTKTFICPEEANLIMCGPGTGIAPMRAFIEERVATGSKGKNWLFYGEQQETEDYLYKEELEKYVEDGHLDITIAWSRTGDDKCYVQDRMRQNAKKIHDWLEDGAVFAVCGDARRMAKDVDKALHEIVAEQGGMSEADAKAYMKNLKKEGRYIRDVF